MSRSGYELVRPGSGGGAGERVRWAILSSDPSGTTLFGRLAHTDPETLGLVADDADADPIEFLVHALFHADDLEATYDDDDFVEGVDPLLSAGDPILVMYSREAKRWECINVFVGATAECS